MEKREIPEKVNVAVYQWTYKEEVIKKSEKISTKLIEENLKNEIWASLKWYRDLKKSTNDERPAYNRLIKDIFEENVNLVILVGDSTRFIIKREILFDMAKKVDIIGMSKCGNIIKYYSLNNKFVDNSLLKYKCNLEDYDVK